MRLYVPRQCFCGENTAIFIGFWRVYILVASKNKYKIRKSAVDFSRLICYNIRMNISFVGGAYESIREIFKIRGISHYVK